MSAEYYVYVYIDPRNNEEFYYGKGKGSRKEAHLADQSDNPKSKRIGDIQRAGVEPIVRVIARDLTEDQALLVEATLLWRLGKFTTNLVAGHFTDKFRPHDTLHRELPGFDFQNRLYYFNVGDGFIANGLTAESMHSSRRGKVNVGGTPSVDSSVGMFLLLT